MSIILLNLNNLDKIIKCNLFQKAEKLIYNKKFFQNINKCEKYRVFAKMDYNVILMINILLLNLHIHEC